jgi:hypothetical protein
MKQAHFVLQGKGGVGKSFISAILAQYFDKKEVELRCFDTDPVNNTFSRFANLNVKHIPLLVNGQSKIDERNFDPIVEEILTADDGIFVIDNGASTFIPMCNYIMENDLMTVLKDNEVEVFIHTIITGGQALQDTLEGLDSIFNQVSNKNIYVWLNPFFGEIIINGKGFTETKFFKDNQSKIKAVINIDQKNPDTFGKDISDMMSNHLTFNESQESDVFKLMAKQRLKQVQRDMFAELDRVVV